MSNNCVYFHINPVKQEIFYVGVGNKNRPNSKQNRNKYWHNSVNKYGYIIVIIEKDLEWVNATEREKFYIKLIGRKDLGLGTLLNMTDGGEGNQNIVMTKESNIKRSLASKGVPKTNARVKRSGHSQETKEKMRLSKLGKKIGPHSEERKLNMKKSAALRKINKSI
jgi:hypothetical protein